MRRNSKRKSMSKRSRKYSKNFKKRLSKSSKKRLSKSKKRLSKRSKKRSYFRIVRTDEAGNIIAEPEQNNNQAGPLTRTRAQNATGQYIPFVQQDNWNQFPQVLTANGANPAFTFDIPDPYDQLLNRYQSNTAQSNSRPVNNELTRSSRHR